MISSCGNLSEKEIEETTSTGVVLVQNQSYYEVVLSNDDVRVSDSEIKYHNEVSIKYNNTFVTNTNDFVLCVVTKSDQEHDLAIIQLKTKSHC